MTLSAQPLCQSCQITYCGRQLAVSTPRRCSLQLQPISEPSCQILRVYRKKKHEDLVADVELELGAPGEVKSSSTEEGVDFGLFEASIGHV